MNKKEIYKKLDETTEDIKKEYIKDLLSKELRRKLKKNR